MELSWRIRRAALALRQRDVADRAGLSQARYSLIERGDAVPTDTEREVIERVLRVPEETKKQLASTFAEQEVSA
jgi:transcriptional regulator with XRE-family HTH domain